MRMSISRESYEQALEEIKEIGRQKTTERGWPDELYEFVKASMGDPYDRSPGRLTYEDVAAFLRKKDWWHGSGGGLAQAFRRERSRRGALGQ